MINLKAGDTGIGLQMTLKSEGNAIDLTDADVLFYMGAQTLTPTFLDRVNGVILVTFYDLTPGIYKAECRVTYADGKVESYPNEGYEIINVQRGVS